ncbi:MAG: F0F1 ATP synthase subunit A [Candidatus Omnitrophota bacterium]|nr:F0F1 ATP synthase subunit A [Candidatus Omnitrophota bacterium]
MELPNFITILGAIFKDSPFIRYLYHWENAIFSFIVICVLLLIVFLALRRPSVIPGRLQNALEVVAGTIDDFVCGILGPKGRKYTPFIGTLFIYIIFMNLAGIIPFMKSPTASWSTTLALALCVFAYVQYTALKEQGIKGYIDHMMGRPRGFLIFTAVIPILLLFVHILSELVRPISLSLRLRSNIWGDDMLLGIMAGFGIKGVPLLFFNTLLVILAGVVQATVFCLLSTIYFALAIPHEEVS